MEDHITVPVVAVVIILLVRDAMTNLVRNLAPNVEREEK
jgi:hypothetical protein